MNELFGPNPALTGLMVGGSVGILIGLLIPTVKIFLGNRFYFEVGRKNNRRVRR